VKLYPFFDVVAAAEKTMAKGGTIYQQFNCEQCGTKQTIDTPNTFHKLGLCEECKATTDIARNGCNYMVVFGKGAVS
jgi:hypothetical protein